MHHPLTVLIELSTIEGVVDVQIALCVLILGRMAPAVWARVVIPEIVLGYDVPSVFVHVPSPVYSEVLNPSEDLEAVLSSSSYWNVYSTPIKDHHPSW
jgi:hypothetical protein